MKIMDLQQKWTIWYLFLPACLNKWIQSFNKYIIGVSSTYQVWPSIPTTFFRGSALMACSSVNPRSNKNCTMRKSSTYENLNMFYQTMLLGQFAWSIKISLRGPVISTIYLLDSIMAQNLTRSRSRSCHLLWAFDYTIYLLDSLPSRYQMIPYSSFLPSFHLNKRFHERLHVFSILFRFWMFLWFEDLP